MRFFAAALLLSVAPALFGQAPPAATDTPSDPQSKVTVSIYHSADGTAEDLNLRHQFGNIVAWLGAYHSIDEKLEGRTGAQLNWQRGAFLVQPMVQAGTTGFLQGSVYSEIGTKWFGIAGFSRTNLEPQDDLTFDPNNSIQLGFGYGPSDADRATFWIIKDDRLGTKQQMSHGIWKHRFGRSALTLDVFYKSGLTDAGRMIHATGAGLYYDHHWFAKLYVDPYASFGESTQVRLSVGKKF